MELVMLLIGFAASLLLVPPRIQGAAQKSTRRVIGALVRKNQRKGVQR